MSRGITQTSYEVPEWSAKPEHKFRLDVLKNGAIVESIPIDQKEYYVVGRIPTCDIVLAHGSISRQHAVIQHRDTGEVFVYDLKSTHRTFKNQRQILSYEYEPYRVGDFVRFGQSTRMYILEGPKNLMPKEQKGPTRKPKEVSSKDRKKSGPAAEAKKKQTAKPKQKPKPAKPKSPTNVFNVWGNRFTASTLQEDGVSWGQGEDAVDDEDEFNEDYLDENKYLTEKNAHLFERLRNHKEKHQNLVHEMGVLRGKEASQGQLSSGQKVRMEQIQERLDTMQTQISSLEETIRDNVQNSISGTSHGGRKSALDRLKQDSDDDDFYDRTKVNRKKRKRTGTMTVESLETELKQIDKQKEKIAARIDRIKNPQKGGSGDIDPLDAYMSSVNKSLDKGKLKTLKLNLKALQKEREEVARLLKIARPSNYSKSFSDLMKKAKTKSSPSQSFRKESSHQTATTITAPSSSSSSTTTPKNEEKVRSGGTTKVKDIIPSDQQSKPKKRRSDQLTPLVEEKEPKKPLLKPIPTKSDLENDARCEREQSGHHSNKSPENEQQNNRREELTHGGLHIKKPKKNRNKSRFDVSPSSSSSDSKRNESGFHDSGENPDWMETEKETSWRPPKDQRGDGVTKLNAKFGY